MVPKPFLTVLVFALPILIVAYGVLMGAATLAQAVDPTAAPALRWVAGGSLILLVIDVVLLVGALGVNALADRERLH